jgi:hypothetical protein
MRRTARLLFLAMLFPCWMYAQTGERVYAFLDLPTSVVAAGNGGQVVASPVADLNLVFHNPALYSASMVDMCAFGYMNYIVDVNAGSVAYGKAINERSRWMAGIRYVDYGTMLWTSETNELLGETTAQDMVISGTYAWSLSQTWRAGGTFNLIHSVLDEYVSAAVAVDLGVYYEQPDRLFTAGLTVMHVGSQVLTYDGTYEALPWDIRLGISKKLSHAPLRFNLTAQNLSRQSLSYLTDEGANDLNWKEQLFCRLVGGVDFIPSEQVLFNLGYNYRRVRELGIEQRTTFGGFSAGMLLRYNPLTVGASFARYHAGGNSLQLTVSFNPSVIGKR